MKLLKPPATLQHNYHLPPRELREFFALRGTAINADRSPVLARGWRGALIVNGRLACNDDSPLARRFKTRPMNGTTLRTAPSPISSLGTGK